MVQLDSTIYVEKTSRCPEFQPLVKEKQPTVITYKWNVPTPPAAIVSLVESCSCTFYVDDFFPVQPALERPIATTSTSHDGRVTDARDCVPLSVRIATVDVQSRQEETCVLALLSHNQNIQGGAVLNDGVGGFFTVLWCSQTLWDYSLSYQGSSSSTLSSLMASR
jgi:hypothetical protein